MMPLRPAAVPLLCLAGLTLSMSACSTSNDAPTAGLVDGSAANDLASPENDKDRMRREQWTDAIGTLEFEGERVLVPDAANVDDPALASSHVSDGMSHMRSNHATAAVKSFRLAIEAAPRSPEGYMMLGQAMIAKGKLDLARASYATAIEIEPNDVHSHASYAEVIAREGRLVEAIDAMERALTLDPEFARAHRKLAVWQYYLGDHTAARVHVDRAEALGEPVPPQFLELLSREGT